MADGGEIVEKSTKNKSNFEQVELEFPSGSDHQNDETGNGDQDQEEHMPIEQEGLHDYQLARDRLRRQIKTPARYAQAETVSFAFNIAEEIESTDPSSFKEGITYKEKQKWIKAMD